MASGSKSYTVLSGLCPDQQCQAKLFFPAHESSIECTQCGQRHEQKSLQDVQQVNNPEVALHNMLRLVLLGNSKLQRGTDSVKVLGLSNYECKLLSPILTYYGMDKATGEAKLLTEMGQQPVFNCCVLGDRAFQLEEEHIDTIGYGRDKTGSAGYLENTLLAIRKANDNEERLIPIHTDGDGHCLVHALSKALIGRELFWHALRVNLKSHIVSRLMTYKALFNDFIDQEEWKDIVNECDPFFRPQDGDALGLRPIHIFGLANVLHRPIILLDSLTGMQSSGDYSGLFLPAMIDASLCKAKDGSFNKPLCLAWSSMGRNHYIALVGVKGRTSPHLPSWMLPRVWGPGMPAAASYIEFDPHGGCVIGGTKTLQDKYIIRLAEAMKTVFMDKHGVSPSLVADVHHYLYKSTGIVGLHQDVVIENTQKAVTEGRLFRCLMCEAIAEVKVVADWLRNGGSLYALAVRTYGRLQPDKKYSFTQQGLVCQYDPRSDELVPDYKLSRIRQCPRCQGSQMRLVRGDGTIQYQNGDRTATRAEKSRCECGFKHYWDGKEYDNLPETFHISLEWAGKQERETVTWFQYESDPGLNSNVFKVAQQLVEKHFPGEFGSERLVQNVVDKILAQTAPSSSTQDSIKSSQQQQRSTVSSSGDNEQVVVDNNQIASFWQPDAPSKITLKGLSQKTVHKEELTVSETERSIQRQISEKAALQQKRKTVQQAARKQEATSPIKTTSIKHLKKGNDSRPEASPGGSTGAQPASGTSTSVNKTEKKVRISTSDGRQMMLTLGEFITYDSLQRRIEAELSIPASRQRIRHGFPPRELHQPESGSDQEALHLQHGDRLIVEVLPQQDMQSSSSCQEQTSTSSKSTSKATNPTPDTSLLTTLNQLQDSSSDSLDTAIASMALMATLMGKDLWTYVTAEPQLFSAGGLFYLQVQRDVGLSDGKHCTLPCLPGKVFRYNSAEDRLELCLEPHGHFPVKPGIGDDVLGTSIPSTQRQISDSLRNILASGSSDIEVNRPMHMPASFQQQVQRSFPGQGHSMKSHHHGDGVMSDDNEACGSHDLLLPSHHKRKVTRGHSSPSNQSTDTTSEQKEVMETDQHHVESALTTREKSPVFTRVGPGCTVLSAGLSRLPLDPTLNAQSIVELDIGQESEMHDKEVSGRLHALAAMIQSRAEEREKEQQKSMEESRQNQQDITMREGDRNQEEICNPMDGNADCVEQSGARIQDMDTDGSSHAVESASSSEQNMESDRTEGLVTDATQKDQNLKET